MNIFDALKLFSFENENFTEEELKKRYKKLVFENHPDRHLENKDKYEEKIKEINSAYEILKDYKKSGIYSNYDIKSFYKKIDNIFSYYEPENLVTFFDLDIYSFLSLKEVEVTLNKIDNCNICKGYKIIKESARICPYCKGTGRITIESSIHGFGIGVIMTSCNKCINGFIFDRCYNCDDRGFIKNPFKFVMDLSKLEIINDSIMFKYSNMGLPEKNINASDYKRGDLFINVRVIPRNDLELFFDSKNKKALVLVQKFTISWKEFVNKKKFIFNLISMKNSKILNIKKIFYFDYKKFTFLNEGNKIKIYNNLDELPYFIYDTGNKIKSASGFEFPLFMKVYLAI